MISKRKELQMGTLAENKANALKQARLTQKQNGEINKKTRRKRFQSKPLSTCLACEVNLSIAEIFLT